MTDILSWITPLMAVLSLVLSIGAISAAHDAAGERRERDDRDGYGNMSLDEWYETTPADGQFLDQLPVDPYAELVANAT